MKSDKRDYDHLSRLLNAHPSQITMIDDPIIANIKPSTLMATTESLLPIGEYKNNMSHLRAFLIENIEIKGIDKKDSLFNCHECLLFVEIGGIRYCNLSLQLFHYDRKKESYNYKLSVPVAILPQQTYYITTLGMKEDMVVILHGKRMMLG